MRGLAIFLPEILSASKDCLLPFLLQTSSSPQGFFLSLSEFLILLSHHFHLKGKLPPSLALKVIRPLYIFLRPRLRPYLHHPWERLADHAAARLSHGCHFMSRFNSFKGFSSLFSLRGDFSPALFRHDSCFGFPLHFPNRKWP